MFPQYTPSVPPTQQAIAESATWVDYVPTLVGPTVTYAYRHGCYLRLNQLCLFHFDIQTSAIALGLTKLSDTVRVSLPVAAVSDRGKWTCEVNLFNALGTVAANLGEIPAGGAAVEILQRPATLLTYALLGTLTGLITIRGEGRYKVA